MGGGQGLEYWGGQGLEYWGGGGGGGPRFRILVGGGQGLEYWGGQGGKFPAGLFQRHMPTRFLINQCQIINLIL